MFATRRRLLAGLLSVPLAGCSGEGSSEDPNAVSCAMRAPRHPQREGVRLQGVTTYEGEFVVGVQLDRPEISVSEATVSHEGDEVVTHAAEPARDAEADDIPDGLFPKLDATDETREFYVRWPSPEVPFDRTYRVTLTDDGTQVDAFTVGGSCRRHDST
ncbi:hypothetical protein [Halorientalis salina]|uniref:hypothetical protein n=1 Tax=Halorientalis salina TaxID=2932266 RepID=UPI0010ADA1BB|nr:hypothetical protein [Halorientalis salina]